MWRLLTRHFFSLSLLLPMLAGALVLAYVLSADFTVATRFGLAAQVVCAYLLLAGCLVILPGITARLRRTPEADDADSSGIRAQILEGLRPLVDRSHYKDAALSLAALEALHERGDELAAADPLDAEDARKLRYAFDEVFGKTAQHIVEVTEQHAASDEHRQAEAGAKRLGAVEREQRAADAEARADAAAHERLEQCEPLLNHVAHHMQLLARSGSPEQRLKHRDNLFHYLALALEASGYDEGLLEVADRTDEDLIPGGAVLTFSLASADDAATESLLLQTSLVDS